MKGAVGNRDLNLNLICKVDSNLSCRLKGQYLLL